MLINDFVARKFFRINDKILLSTMFHKNDI